MESFNESNNNNYQVKDEFSSTILTTCTVPTMPAEPLIIEYPLNYLEIVDRKLNLLEKEYDDTIRSEIVVNNNYDSDNSSENECIYAEKDDHVTGDKNKVENDNFNSSNVNEGDNKYKYYQCLNECEDDFLDVDEPHSEEVKNEDKNYIGDQIIEKQSVSVLNSFEFVEDKNSDSSTNHKIYKPGNPLKNPEKIKNAMKQIKMVPPKWAQK